MAEKSALGKGFDGLGLNSLFESNTQRIQKDDVYQELNIDSLSACLSQPRKYFNEEQLNELAASIQEKGIVQPLVVRPISDGKYEIVAGERRYRAAKILNLEKVPVVIRNYSESEAMTIALIENIQREDLNPIEEAEAYALLKEKYKLSQDALAKSLGKNRSTLANSLRLLNLPSSMRELIFQKKLSAAHGRTLLALHNEELQEALAQRILKHNLSVRDAENLAEYANAYQSLPKELSLTSLSDDEQELSSSQENTQEQEAQSVESAPVKQHRRPMPKSEFLLQLQKLLRKEVHRGTKISGSLENGKLILPFSGQNELEHLLHLLSFEHSLPADVVQEDIIAEKLVTEELVEKNQANAKTISVEIITAPVEVEENTLESADVEEIHDTYNTYDSIEENPLIDEEDTQNLPPLQGEEEQAISENADLDLAIEVEDFSLDDLADSDLEEDDFEEEVEELSLNDLDDDFDDEDFDDEELDDEELDDEEQDDEDADEDLKNELNSYESGYDNDTIKSGLSSTSLNEIAFEPTISDILDTIEKQSGDEF